MLNKYGPTPRALAHFHAYSTVIQRDSEEALIELWPFAVEAANFKVEEKKEN